MRFGFDIDDTLINLREHAFHIYNKKLKQNIPLEIFNGLNKVEIHEPFGMTPEDGAKMWNNSLEEIYYTNCPPYPEVIEILQALETEGHEIFYITARPSEHGERTKKWMIEKGFPVRDENFYCGMKDQEKVTIIQKLQLDYYFDDKPDVLNTLANSSTKVFVKTQSYNKHLTIPRFSEWSEWKHLVTKSKL
ncbi:5' nucleotidase, NT5C type [Bacillus sp. FJAT-22090]|uniref:5' nucleotidase, NT5C type n=1 Tax=Bacillus sp. FJAT-22090 TaxID=1581038 RepID=UPI0011A034F0|nr:HAD hydrolase-like protein [Bacillus sp. FJAT-22090]